MHRSDGSVTSDFSIVNQTGATSYPISGYSWPLVHTHQPSQVTGQALVAMLDWLTHDGQAYAAVNRFTCPCHPRSSSSPAPCSSRSPAHRDAPPELTERQDKTRTSQRGSQSHRPPGTDPWSL